AGSEYPEELKYDFNIKGELRHLDTNEPFVFNYYKNSHEQNHKRYQVLGHLITQYVYELLERVCMLQKVYIPTDATEDEPRTFFFMSENALTSYSSLIVLLQDRGVFCAGQWGQRTIVSEGLEHGTQIPFIKMALQKNERSVANLPNYSTVRCTPIYILFLITCCSFCGSLPGQARTYNPKIRFNLFCMSDYFQVIGY
uniref:Arb2 domain-containing protein n=1 Tax=Calidris pygmaea TaxID=425635 RepID=A0A8C3K4Z4_9CHAR